MSTPTFPRPTLTPHPLKTVLWALFFVSIGGYALQWFHIPFANYLSLSASHISSGYVWTLLTYPFVYTYTHLIDLLFHLGFNLVFLWVFGIPLLERIGTKRFLILFFGATLFSGLTASLTLYLLHSPQLFAGPTPPLFALITAWTILHNVRNIHLSHFVMRPIWVFAFLVGLNLALDALAGLWAQLVADASAAVFGYFFCLISEKIRSPIAALYPFERAVFRSIEKLHTHHQKPSVSKIVDFKTGEPILNDDQFIDVMLSKITDQGESSLTPEEKTRMQKISEKRSRGKK